jgi:hypothetical protein
VPGSRCAWFSRRKFSRGETFSSEACLVRQVSIPKPGMEGRKVAAMNRLCVMGLLSLVVMAILAG